MSELAARRRQLIQLITMEKNRREQMPRWLRADQESLIRILENRVEKLDAREYEKPNNPGAVPYQE